MVRIIINDSNKIVIVTIAGSNGDGVKVHVEQNARSTLSVSTVMGDRLILEFCGNTNWTRRKKGGQVDML